MNSGLFSVDDTVGAEELVVPSDEGGINGVVVGDEFSVGHVGEVELRVNVSKSLLNNVEDAVKTGLVGVLSSN